MKVLPLSIFVVILLVGRLHGFGLPKFDPEDRTNKAAWGYIQRIVGNVNSNFRAIELKCSVAEEIVIENINLRTTAEKNSRKLVVRKGNGRTLIYFSLAKNPAQINLDGVNKGMIPAGISNIGIGYTVENKRIVLLVVVLGAIKYPSELGQRPQLLGLPTNSKANLIADAYAIKQDSLRKVDHKIVEVLGTTYGAILFPPGDLENSLNLIRQLNNPEHDVILQLNEMQKDGILANVSISALLQTKTTTVASEKNLSSTRYYHLVVFYEWKIPEMTSTERETILDGLSSWGGLLAARRTDPFAQNIAEIKSCLPLNPVGSKTVSRAYGHRIYEFNLPSDKFSVSAVKDVTETGLKLEIKDLGSVDKILGVGFAIRKTKENAWHLFIVLVVLEKPIFGIEVSNLAKMKFNAVAIILAPDCQNAEPTPKAAGEFQRKYNLEFRKKDNEFPGLKSLLETDESIGVRIESRRGGFLWCDEFITVSIIYCRHHEFGQTQLRDNSKANTTTTDSKVPNTNIAWDVRPNAIKENSTNPSIGSRTVTPPSKVTPTPGNAPQTHHLLPQTGATPSLTPTPTPTPTNATPATNIPEQIDASPTATSPTTTAGKPTLTAPTPVIVAPPLSILTAPTNTNPTSIGLPPTNLPPTPTIPTLAYTAPGPITLNSVQATPGNMSIPVSTNTTATEVTKKESTIQIPAGTETNVVAPSIPTPSTKSILETSFKDAQIRGIRKVVRDAVTDELSNRYKSKLDKNDRIDDIAKQCAEVAVPGAEHKNVWFVLSKEYVAYRVPDFHETSTMLHALNELMKAYPEVKDIATDCVGVYWHKIGETENFKYTFCLVYHIMNVVSKPETTTVALPKGGRVEFQRNQNPSSLILPVKYSSLQNVVDPRLKEITFSMTKTVTVTTMLAILENLSKVSIRGQQKPLEMCPQAVLNAVHAPGSTAMISEDKYTSSQITFSNADVGYKLRNLEGKDTFLSAMKKIEQFSTFYKVLSEATRAGICWQPEKYIEDRYVFCIVFGVSKVSPQAPVRNPGAVIKKDTTLCAALTIRYLSNPVINGQVQVEKQLGPNSHTASTTPSKTAHVTQVSDSVKSAEKMTTLNVAAKEKDTPEKTGRNGSNSSSPPTVVKFTGSVSNLPATKQTNQNALIDMPLESFGIPSDDILKTVVGALRDHFGKEPLKFNACKNQAFMGVANRDSRWTKALTPIQCRENYSGFRVRNLKGSDSIQTALDKLQTLPDFKKACDAATDAGCYWQQTLSETDYMFCVVFNVKR